MCTNAVGRLFATAAFLLLTQIGHTATIEEIVVTAQKRAESIQDVPIAMSAFGEDAIDTFNFEYGPMLAAQVPNVSYTDPGTGIPTFSIRGVQLFDFTNANEAPVGFYVDEVYYGTAAGQFAQFFDAERVEVMRGPQGILFGRNTTGGLVHVISNKPADEFELSASFQAGSYGQRIFEGMVNVPMGEHVRGRLSLKSNRDDGFQENTAGGPDLTQTDVWALRGQLQADLSDAITVLLNIHGSRTDGRNHGYAYRGLLDPATLLDPVPTPCEPAAVIALQCTNAFGVPGQPLDPETVAQDESQATNEIDTLGGSVTFNWEIGEMSLVSVTAYEEVERLYVEDADATGVAFLTTNSGLDANQFSQELRLSGRAFDTRLDWLVGAYYYDDKKDDIFLRLPILIDLLGATLGLQSESNQETESKALFANVNYALNDSLSGFLGLRFTDEDKDYQLSDSLSAPTLGVINDSVSTSKVTARAGVEYRLQEDVMVYLTYATGFKSAQFNNSSAAILSLDASPVGEETVLSLEAGMKGSWLNERLRANLTAFRSHYEDFQALALLPGEVRSSLISAGEVDIYGAEFDLAWQASENLLLSMGVGYLQTEIDSPGTTVGGLPIDGNELPNAPEFTVNGLVRYALPTSGFGTFSLQADFNYVDDNYFHVVNNPIEFQASYTLVNLRAGWTSPSTRVAVDLFVENVTDEDYFSFSGNVGDTNISIWGRPRWSGIRLSYAL